jgi:hypothetical protein
MNPVSNRARSAFRTIIAGVICALALALTGAAPASARCFKGDLRLVYHGQTVIGGHTFWDFAFRNSGLADCVLQGYTSAALLGHHGQPLTQAGAQVAHQPGHPTPAILLRPGHSAFFTFAWSSSAPCPHPRFNFYRVEFEPPSPLFHPQMPPLPARSICPNTARVTPFRAHL